MRLKIRVGLWGSVKDSHGNFQRKRLDRVKAYLTDVSPNGEYGIVEFAESSPHFSEVEEGETKEIEMDQVIW